MTVIIDRFEGDFAVVEMPDKTFLNVPKALFSGLSEGDAVKIEKDSDETEKRKRNAQKAFSSLFKK